MGIVYILDISIHSILDISILLNLISIYLRAIIDISSSVSVAMDISILLQNSATVVEDAGLDPRTVLENPAT